MKKRKGRLLRFIVAWRKKYRKYFRAQRTQLRKKATVKKLKKLSTKRWFGRTYVGVALLVLLGSALLWTILGARLQSGNADQLVNSLLFQNGQTLHGSSLPGAHSFFLKWPIFWLIAQLHYSVDAYMWATVGSVLLTLAILVYLLYRLDRRPLVFGSLCLALASCLMLVPAQSYNGALLPVNMAMLATRNLEYALYILSIVLLVQARHLKGWRAWTSLAILAVVIASDKLFLTLSIGGALGALVVYAFFRREKLVNVSARWLIHSAAATIGAFIIIHVVNLSGLLNIGGGTTPYQLAPGLKDILLACIYAVAGVFTNFGANPAYQTVIARDVPHGLLHGLLSFGVLGYILNAVMLVFGLFVVVRFVVRTIFSRKVMQLDRAAYVVLMLIWSSVVAIGAFIVTNHYYAVDARYLTIVLFAIFAGLAYHFRGTIKKPGLGFLALGCAALVAIGLSSVFVVHNYHASQQAASAITARNKLVSGAFEHHPESTLVGDYWRVVPIKAANSKVSVTPLGDCLTPRGGLSSTAWQPDLQKHSFAYLLSLDGSQTDFPHCSLAQVTGAYGFPDSSAVIAGSLQHPQELVLFYDHGAHPSKLLPNDQLSKPATVVPVALQDLMHTACDGPADVNVVAHQDDDLLFMNPDILHAIQEGHCERTIYVTAGDAGSGSFYWLERQRGSEAAYDKMIGTSAGWTERVVQIADHAYATIANPKGNTKISLIFLHLPDGNLLGQGFGANGNQSLERLNRGSISTINAIDGQSSYSKSELIGALADIMQVYQPALVRTQAPYSANSEYPDHSDHIAVGQLARAAHDRYEEVQFAGGVSIPISYYVGYPVHALSANLGGADLDAKEAIFFRYAQFDGSVCRTQEQCNAMPTYGNYLDHQYTTEQLGQ